VKEGGSCMGRIARGVVAAVLLSAVSAVAADQRPETLDRCGLEFVDCATGPESNCIVDGVQLEDACVQRCERAWDACLRADGAPSAPREQRGRRPSSSPGFGSP
jgi:hypothetical protein